MVRKRTLAREASTAAGRKVTSTPGDGSQAAQAARRAAGSSVNVGPESSRPRARPPSESYNTPLNQLRARLRRPSPAQRQDEQGAQAKLLKGPNTKNEPVFEGESVAQTTEQGTPDKTDTRNTKPNANGIPPSKKGASTFEEMGYKSEALDSKDCIIM